VKKLNPIALAMLVGLISSSAWAVPVPPGSARTFVSATSGRDAGPCTLQYPCLTFNYALSQTSWGGEVIAIASGSYAPVTITQSVTLEAAPGVYVGITAPASGAGVSVNGISGALVVLRGLTITQSSGGGNGINFTSGLALTVENCVINGNGSTENVGILNVAEDSELFVKDTVVHNFFIDVVIASPYTTASLSNVLLEGSLEDDGYAGLLVVAGAATISNSVIGNSYDGIYADGGLVNVESCQVANNVFGVEVDDGGIATVSNSTVTDNFEVGLYNDGGTLYSRQNNTVAGNGTPTSGTITPLSPL
jgi:hypothetical protein